QIGLKKTAGASDVPETIGPFQAMASSGQDNAPNVNWYAYVPHTPPLVIDGTYECTDTGTATWSSDKESGGQGFCIVKGVPAKRNETGTSSTTTTTTTTTPKCPGYENDSRKQIVGTNGPDNLVGGPEDDIICGLGGDDTLSGGAGNDLILGGGGNDTIDGGP